jgi:hypothetical protein
MRQKLIAASARAGLDLALDEIPTALTIIDYEVLDIRHFVHRVAGAFST